jgi:hypothetical protein
VEAAVKTSGHLTWVLDEGKVQEEEVDREVDIRIARSRTGNRLAVKVAIVGGAEHN